MHRTRSHKQYLPLVCYTTKDGPWRDCLIRYGFDPRADRSSRLCVSVTASSHHALS
jgi:hypothetical protein